LRKSACKTGSSSSCECSMAVDTVQAWTTTKQVTPYNTLCNSCC
jgi:hypothetical protein